MWQKQKREGDSSSLRIAFKTEARCTMSWLSPAVVGLLLVSKIHDSTTKDEKGQSNLKSLLILLGYLMTFKALIFY